MSDLAHHHGHHRRARGSSSLIVAATAYQRWFSVRLFFHAPFLSDSTPSTCSPPATSIPFPPRPPPMDLAVCSVAARG